MGQFESFAKILEKKIRQEVESEVMSEVEAFLAKNFSTGPSQKAQVSPLQRSEQWMGLLGNLSQFTVTAESKAQAYHKHRSPPKPRPPHSLDSAQSIAFEFFARKGATLTSSFNSKDLKAQFRTLALQLHPDQGGSAEAFQSLMLAYRELQRLFA